MTSGNGLHWSNPLSKTFMPVLSDFVLIDGIHKTNIYDLSLIVTTVVDSLGKSVPFRFLLAPSEHSDSITRHMHLLKLTGDNCIDPSFINTRSIMTDEGSALVKIASGMAGYYHCLCAFHINQLDVRVSTFVSTKCMLSSLNCQHTFLEYVCPRINELSHLINNIYHHVSIHFVKQNICCHYWFFQVNLYFLSFQHTFFWRNVRCHELSHSINNIYHHVSIHFVKTKFV